MGQWTNFQSTLHQNPAKSVFSIVREACIHMFYVYCPFQAKGQPYISEVRVGGGGGGNWPHLDSGLLGGGGNVAAETDPRI